MEPNPLDEILESKLATDLDTVSLAQGEVLFTQGEPGDTMYIVRSGRLRALVAVDGGAPMVAGEIGPGEPVGELHLVTGGGRSATVVALTETELLEIPVEMILRVATELPLVFEQMVTTVRRRIHRNQLLTRLPDLFAILDDSLLDRLEDRLEWIQLPRGSQLMEQGQEGDDLYIVVSGRLQAVTRGSDGEERVLAEIPPGESVGEMAMLLEQPRSASLYALRDSVLLKVTRPVFEEIVTEHPEMLRYLTRHVARRLSRALSTSAVSSRVATVVIVPLDGQAREFRFATRLAEALRPHGSTLHLTGKRFESLAGVRESAAAVPESAQELRTLAWLDEQERRYRFVLFEADGSLTWTRRCLRQADRILLVAGADSEAAPLAIEEEISRSERRCPQVLVLLHKDGSRPPTGTRRWLAGHECDAHFHLRGDTEADFHRLARRLADRSVGLVLGGGGARGFAHIGVIRAMREAGLAIDAVGGTSMGAFIAAQAALEWDYETMIRVNRQQFVESNALRAYTLPLFSLLRNRGLDRGAHEMFEESHIEDLWIDCFFVSSSINDGKAVLHRRGPVWKAVRASSALPGITQPVVLNGQLHIDGALVNNLPVDVMRQSGAGQIIAVDVSATHKAFQVPEVEPNPWRHLARVLLRRRQEARFPTIMEVLSRSAFLGGAEKNREARRGADLYLQPPVSAFRHLDFSAIEAIAEIGYGHAREAIRSWLSTRDDS